jgi:site-specific recombinase XerD
MSGWWRPVSLKAQSSAASPIVGQSGVSGISEKVVWLVVRQSAKVAALDKVAPHDLRRTCARLCHSAGGELEQIQFLLGHRSVETTERYLGSRQRIVHAVNDKLGIEPEDAPG